MTGKFEIQLVQVFDKTDKMLMMYPVVGVFADDIKEQERLVKDYRCTAILARHPEYTKDDLNVIIFFKDFSEKGEIPEINGKTGN